MAGLEEDLARIGLSEYGPGFRNFGVQKLEEVSELQLADLEELGLSRVQARRLQRVAIEKQVLSAGPEEPHGGYMQEEGKDFSVAGIQINARVHTQGDNSLVSIVAQKGKASSSATLTLRGAGAEAPPPLLERELIAKYFQSLDVNLDQKISMAEMKRAFPDWSERDSRDLFTRFDKDRDGYINYVEFVDWVMSSATTTLSRQPSFALPSTPAKSQTSRNHEVTEMKLKIDGIDYDKLKSRPPMIATIKKIIKRGVIQGAGEQVKETSVHVELSKGSVLATIKIFDDNRDAVLAVICQLKSSLSLTKSIATSISGMPGVNAVKNGPVVVSNADSEDGHDQCPRTLIVDKAELTKQCSVGDATLNQASYAGHEQCVKSFLEARADLETPQMDDIGPRTL